MNIVHVAESFAGGVFDFLVALAHGLPEFSHTIIYGKREDTPLSFEERFPRGTRFYLWQHAAREINPVHDIRALSQIIALLKGMKNADVIHLHSSKAGFLGRLACRMLGIQDRVIYSPQGVSFLRKDLSVGKVRLFTYLEKTAARFGGQVIGSCASEAAAFAEVGITATYINNGIACEEYFSARPRHTPMVIGTAARITPQKNPSLFNEIAQAFLPDPQIRFLWMGDGELRHQLSSPNIQITGWMPKDELTQRLQLIDIYLSTSLWEGLPLSVLLAMCAGKPVVLSDCSGNRDLVENGRNGFRFVDKDEAISCIVKLKADAHLVQRMGQSSHELLLDNFHLGTMICQYKELYAAVAKADTKGPFKLIV